MELSKIIEFCNLHLKELGFECYPFQIGWYNENVAERYKLTYPDDTLAVLIISAPRVFETVFLPWLKVNANSIDKIGDPIDRCMDDVLGNFHKQFPSTMKVDLIHDYELSQGRYPRILTNTAGHVSGAAYYYQKIDVSAELANQKKLFGVSLHPVYGGWFAFRAVFIFPSVKATDLPRPHIERVLETSEKVYNLLEAFTYRWQTNEWRDAHPAAERYSDMQREYFSLLPAKRLALISRWVDDRKL